MKIPCHHVLYGPAKRCRQRVTRFAREARRMTAYVCLLDIKLTFRVKNVVDKCLCTLTRYFSRLLAIFENSRV
jgi:hypothetical protein